MRGDRQWDFQHVVFAVDSGGGRVAVASFAHLGDAFDSLAAMWARWGEHGYVMDEHYGVAYEL